MSYEQITAGLERGGKLSRQRRLGGFIEVDRHVAAEDRRKAEVARLVGDQVEALETNPLAIFGAHPVRTLPAPISLQEISLQPGGRQTRQLLRLIHRGCARFQ